MANWTPERTQLLVKLIDEGALSCDAIADRLSKEFGETYTKNAITGKIGRLGLKHVNAPRTANSGSGRRSRKRELSSRGQNAHIVRRLRAIKVAMAEPTAYVPKVDDRAAAAPLYISLFELTEQSCRWPYGNESYSFCGHQTEQGSPYCSHHADLSRSSARPKAVYVPERLLGKRAA